MKTFVDLLPVQDKHVICDTQVYRIDLRMERTRQVPMLYLSQVIPTDDTPMVGFEIGCAIVRLLRKVQNKKPSKIIKSAPEATAC